MHDFKSNPQFQKLANKKVLVTGGAGFIGSNLCEALLDLEAQVVCLDNFATGHRHNIEEFFANARFTLIEGDIRNLETCQRACEDVDFVLHEAALGSVPRSINDPITSNEVNVSGFLNMLVAARDKGVKRFIYAASSSTYGDSTELPKVEERIGRPLSPYAVTKYVNELYADVFHKTYGLDTIGLRYFNVFGRRQDPNGAYAAVIPLFIKKLMNHESPVINGDGSYSRDFTYIDNVILMNLLCLTTANKGALNQVYNTAGGERTTLLELTELLKKHLGKFDQSVKDIPIKYGPERSGDVPHSMAALKKAYKYLHYESHFGLDFGLGLYINWIFSKK